LPGDIVLRGERFTFYFPMATCALLSLLVSLLVWIAWRWGKP
jgi:hypothetical protein